MLTGGNDARGEGAIGHSQLSSMNIEVGCGVHRILDSDLSWNEASDLANRGFDLLKL